MLSGICSANCRNRISGRHDQLIAVARVVGSLRLTQDKVEKIQPKQNNGLQVNQIIQITVLDYLNYHENNKSLAIVYFRLVC